MPASGPAEDKTENTGRHLPGLLAILCVALLIPALEYAAHMRLWIPSHDDTLSLSLTSGTLAEAKALLEPTSSRALTAGDVVRLLEPPRSLRPVAMAREVYELEIHPPLYFIVLHAWRRLTGGLAGPAIVLSVLFGVVAAGLLYRLVARHAGAPAGFLVALLFCLTPVYREAALTARQYGLSACLAVPLAGILLARLRAGRNRSPGDAAMFVIAAALCGLTAYQTLPLVVTLVAVWWLDALLAGIRKEIRTATIAAGGLALVGLLLVSMARRQGHHLDALGTGGWLLAAPTDAREATRAGLQAFLSLFLDLPFTWIPLPLLAIGAGLFPVLLVLALAGGRLSPDVRVPLLAIVGGPALYASLVLLGLFPARFHVYYFAGAAAVFLGLLAAALPDETRRRRRAFTILGLLCLVSGASFVARLLRGALIDLPRDRVVLEELAQSSLLITDARHLGHVLRVAPRLSPEAAIWIVRLPIEPSVCQALRVDARLRGATLARLGEDDPAILEASIRGCIGGATPHRRHRLKWLDLVRWEPAPVD